MLVYRVVEHRAIAIRFPRLRLARRWSGVRPEDSADAAILLVLEHLVAAWRLVQGHLVRDQVAGVEVAGSDAVEQHGD